ncbi:MAG TPA: hypothetical protein VN939_22380 [Chthoniobacterales bacterium]|nr:hypothetical protein [Chthoniobacterales bacterium]
MPAIFDDNERQRNWLLWYGFRWTSAISVLRFQKNIADGVAGARQPVKESEVGDLPSRKMRSSRVLLN